MSSSRSIHSISESHGRIYIVPPVLGWDVLSIDEFIGWGIWHKTSLLVVLRIQEVHLWVLGLILVASPRVQYHTDVRMDIHVPPNSFEGIHHPFDRFGFRFGVGRSAVVSLRARICGSYVWSHSRCEQLAEVPEEVEISVEIDSNGARHVGRSIRWVTILSPAGVGLLVPCHTVGVGEG